jgi:hypothetical protein
MTDKNIKRFQLEVTVKDSSVYMKKVESYVKMLEDDMRSKGYIPVLDLGVHTKVDYNGKAFNYTLTMHGVYLGRKKAWETQGLAGGKIIPKTTTTSKSVSSLPR